MCDCCQQTQKTEHKKVEELLDILERKPDADLPKFCGALKETRQFDIVDILKKKGLNARAAIRKIITTRKSRYLCGTYLCLHQIVNVYITYFHKSAYFYSI